MTIAIVDYGSGNLHSAAKAFERVAGAGKVTVTSDPAIVARADRIVLPGVGAFGDCRRGLYAVDGMVEALRDAVIDRGMPFLGICVGMQLMAERGLEFGEHAGLGWIAGDVVPITPSDPALKVPHMGWNDLRLSQSHPVIDRLPAGAHMYFVHSNHFRCTDPAHVLATVDYGGPVTAVVGRDNMIGSQFHPEKSQKSGLAFIEAFLGWKP
ncbi:MAG: imidazole glycerol phosphate synthase subunit HisH [Alphaproteobacteria bacterium]|nr:imidazole glycerol phosphate synthase subunit HisH [Alphaproteobacteria bacterium]